jgi:hypothetical protein
MPIIDITFPRPLNVSVQIGDTAYFSNPTPVGATVEWEATITPHQTNSIGEVIKIGEIINIIITDTFSTIVCDMPQDLFNSYFPSLQPGSFIMFSKDNKVNMANMLGYYASVEFKNDSTEKAELFAASAEVHESSK